MSYLALLAAVLGCSRQPSEPVSRTNPTANVATSHPPGSTTTTALSAAVPSLPPAAPAQAKLEEGRVIRFPYRPKAGTSREYEMVDGLDQHQIWIAPGVKPGTPKVLVALHGQPRRGKSPRDYDSPRVFTEVVRELVASGAIEPLVLLIPVFRFEGTNWPGFSISSFLAEANRRVLAEGIHLSLPYVIGHSGAAGCGGGGLNDFATLLPSAVGFFDTCIGMGFRHSVRELTRRHIPTLILHSVETAGYSPREPIEYNDHFDYGKVYGPLGILPSTCPSVMPEVPLRSLDSRCAATSDRMTEALVLDTGTGEAAHNGTIPVGLRYFLKRFLGRPVANLP